MSILTEKTAGYVNLSYCVALAQMDLDDYSSRLREKMTQYAIMCFNDLNIFTSVNVEVVYLEMDPDGIVDISGLTDYVDYVKVGIPVNGKWWILNKNKKILKNRDELSDTEAAYIFQTGESSIDVDTGYYFAGHYLSGQYQTGIFGLGGGFSRSYFNIDMEKQQIQFDTSVPTSEIILEYVSTGVKASGATTVPRDAVEYIRAYIHWQLTEFNPNASRFDKKWKYDQFIERENMMKAFRRRFRKEDFYNAIFSTQKQTLKS